MPVQPFASCDEGLKDQLSGAEDYLAGNVTAVLVDTAHTPNRATDLTYADISANECADPDYAQQAVAGKTVGVVSQKTRFDHSKVTFTAAGTVSGRYVYYVFGTAGALVGTNRILGYVDLTGAGNASSTNAEFSYDPPATGLFEIARTAAP